MDIELQSVVGYSSSTATPIVQGASDMKVKENFVTESIQEDDLERGSIDVLIDEKPSHQMQRGLKSRHMQLIALGCAIGTGLFIGTGGALSTCGPAPLLISYIIMSFFVWTIMHQLTEMVVLTPIPGEASMYALARAYLNRPLSFMCGWNLFYAQAMIAPSEITASTLLIQYWTDANSAIFVSIFIVITIAVTALPVKVFGESEFWVSMIKLITITGLIILGVVIFFGGGPNQHHVLGFHYWKHPGAFKPHISTGNTGKFLAVWTAIIKSGFAFILSPETLTSCSAEADRPRRNMPRAANRFVWRLMLFYIGGALVVGVTVGYDNQNLLSAIASGQSNAAASPFVIGIKEVGIKVLPHIINAAILTGAYSAGTAEMYGASRMLHSMALKGNAPKIFSRVNRYGVPYYSIIVPSCFCFLAYLNCSNSASQVFTWLTNISTISGFISWVFVSITYVRFRRVIDYLDLNDRIKFRKPFQRIFAYFSGCFFVILSLTNGYAVFTKGNWSVSDFFANYITIGFVVVLFIMGTAYYKEWKFRDMEEIRSELIPKIDMADEEESNEIVIEPTTWYGKLGNVLI
ncbi:hypothetical protein ZYGR_0AI07840 [Zygosaccharomyces rouxii]|uniref:Amino acid permease/ SLC12A domain-containing protein n=1 Tax=Zygosaccharomyces rouxii TaxID=4956 RepID=A0A1Q3ACY9_ZYGRO|nr:hypothetical protein ZYGR_0AI07840 [Zygosaccharomyces rouxii]